MKRINAPKHLMLDKLSGIFVSLMRDGGGGAAEAAEGGDGGRWWWGAASARRRGGSACRRRRAHPAPSLSPCARSVTESACVDAPRRARGALAALFAPARRVLFSWGRVPRKRRRRWLSHALPPSSTNNTGAQTVARPAQAARVPAARAHAAQPPQVSLAGRVFRVVVLCFSLAAGGGARPPPPPPPDG
jgi:hypothetical protein